MRSLPLLVAVLLAASFAAAQPPVPDSAIVRIVAPAGRDSWVTGSGFFVDSRHIVTNEHVVAKARSPDEIAVVPAEGAIPQSVRLIWSDTDLDLAVVALIGRIAHESLPVFASVPMRGIEVFAAGYPGLADVGSLEPSSSTLTDGILSRDPSERSWGASGASALTLQHTATISPGSSGGPLVNECGHVIGINTGGIEQEVTNEKGEVIGTTSAGAIFLALDASELRPSLDRLRVNYQTATSCDAESSPTVPPAGGGGGVATGGGTGDGVPFSWLLLVLAILLTLAALALALRLRSPPAAPPPEESPPEPGTPAVPPLRLAGLGGPDLMLAGDALESARNGISFGRRATLVDQALADPTLSRRHFRLSLHEGRVFVEDLHSKHGTFVGNERLTPYHARRLETGDVVRAGAGSWRFGGVE